ncbi:hypothetical protein SAMN05428965_1622 [Geodermatophilus sp. DSM 45219]|nr:hypothetical protein SAMN05428965_1622 [Geodermatophilus sp. DSM 45219]
MMEVIVTVLAFVVVGCWVLRLLLMVFNGLTNPVLVRIHARAEGISYRAARQHMRRRRHTCRL